MLRIELSAFVGEDCVLTGECYSVESWLSVDALMPCHIRNFAGILRRDTHAAGRQARIIVSVSDENNAENFLRFTLMAEVCAGAFGRKSHWMHAECGNIVYTLRDVIREAETGDTWIFEKGGVCV